MKNIHVVYHEEDEGWWGESADLPGFSAAGDTFEEVRQQVKESMPFFCGEEVDICEAISLLGEDDKEMTISLDSLLLLSLASISPRPKEMIPSPPMESVNATYYCNHSGLTYLPACC